VLRTDDETSVTIKDHSEERVTKHANDHPMVLAGEGVMDANLSEANNNVSNANDGVETREDIHQHFEVNRVRTINIIMAFSGILI